MEGDDWQNDQVLLVDLQIDNLSSWDGSTQCVGQGVEYHIGKFSNADISDFSVSRRVYRVEPPISSIFNTEKL